MSIDCPHWSRCGSRDGGCCDLGLFGGRPSRGICLTVCDQRPSERPSGGPGTELKKLLRRVGINATSTCSCNRYARTMNQRGPQWCRDNIETIVGWLEGEANKRKLPFSRLMAKLLIRRAIANVSREQKTRITG